MDRQVSVVKEVVEKLGEYKGQVVHSSEMDKLIASSSDGKNAVEGKRILMIGYSFSAVDLALQCIKLGAEHVYVASRKLAGSAVYMGSWPEDKVKILPYAELAGVKDDGTGKTLVFDTLKDDNHVPDVEDVSIVIFCTGYTPNLSLRRLWRMEYGGCWRKYDNLENERECSHI
jgi:cation diffusion facilitator CzcD-associated flavoprotein CzcO